MRRLLKKILLICVSIIIISCVWYILTQKPIYHPKVILDINEGYDSVKNAKEDEEKYIEMIKKGETEGKIIRSEKLPETWENNQYITVLIKIKGKNITPFRLDIVNGKIEGETSESKLLYSEGWVKSQNINVWENKSFGVIMVRMYKGDMTYDEVEKYISNYKLVMSYNIPVLGKQEVTIPMKNAKIKKILRENSEGYMEDILCGGNNDKN